MDMFSGLMEALDVRGSTLGSGRDLKLISVVEHDEVDLPRDLIRTDGSLDIHESVQKYFDIQYKRKKKGFIVRPGGWIGQIPINDRYTLCVETKVPVFNLEKVFIKSLSDNTNIIGGYDNAYQHAEEKPKSLYDVLADRFILAIRRILGDGLLKEYRRIDSVSASPIGRLHPFKTTAATYKSMKPTAHYSTYERTIDVPANRVIHSSLKNLLEFYNHSSGRGDARRQQSLVELADHFVSVGFASKYELEPSAMRSYVQYLPVHRNSYLDALRLAGYIVAGLGLSVRGANGLVIAPAAVVDFAAIFESFARQSLSERAQATGIAVLNGNIAGEGGGKKSLYREMFIDIENPDMKPDIILNIGNESRMIIDVKYKNPGKLPDRSEVDQLVCYAVRYECDKVMVLYPAFPTGRTAPVERIGDIGNIRLFRGVIDIGNANLEQSEMLFSESVVRTINN